MLPQIFKWDDKSKQLITGELNELELLSKRKEFIKAELGLNEIIVITSEKNEADSDKTKSSLPLSPSIIYA